MKETYFSNCYIEAKKAKRNGCTIIKLGYFYTGKIIPHFFWYNPKENAYFDFHKMKSSSNDFFYKGYVRKTSKDDFIKHINRWVANNISEIEKVANIPVAQNNLDGGTSLFPRDWWFEPERCTSGKVLYVEIVDGKETYKVDDVNNLEIIDNDMGVILKKLADNINVIGWMYWNVY